MLPSFRILTLAALCALAAGAIAQAADDALPPEPTTGEWLADTLADGSLWFASSENLGFEAVARELTEYPRGRRWVRVVDGKPAWVMYYVPEEILGFEVDTHHFGAAATEFQFAAGADWSSLTTVTVDYEEIVAFEAKWLRLYRAADQLPPGTHFLKIEFPSDADVDAARLTEVWLRCRFDDGTVPVEERQAPVAPAVAAPTTTQAAAVANEPEIEPLVVTTFLYQPSPPPAPVFPPVNVDRTRPAVQLDTAPRVTRYDLFGDFVALVETPPPSPPLTSKSAFSRIFDFLRHR